MFSVPLKYNKQIMVPEIGLTGHEKIRKSRVLIIGAGALGIPAAFYLASSGVGKIGVVDGDVVEESNLGRQIAYSHKEIGQKKSLLLAQKLSILNSDVEALPYDLYFNSANAYKIAEEYDVFLNASDNLKTRFLINEVAQKQNKTWINAAVTQLKGEIAVFTPGRGCFECLYPRQNSFGQFKAENIPEKNCVSEGVLAPLCGMFGSWGASLAMQSILGFPFENKLYTYQAVQNSFREFRWKKNIHCPRCHSENNLAQLPFAKENLLHNNKMYSLTTQQLQTLHETTDNVVMVDLTSFGVNSNLWKDKWIDLGRSNIPSSIKMNFDEFFSKNCEEPSFLNRLKKEFFYVFFCEYGVKSRLAAEVLNEEGFQGYFLK